MSERKAHTANDAMECMSLHSQFNNSYESILQRLEAFNDIVHAIVVDLEQQVQAGDIYSAEKHVSSLQDATQRFFDFEPVQRLNNLITEIEKKYQQFPAFKEASWDVWKSSKHSKINYDTNHDEFQHMQKEMLHIRDGIAQLQGDRDITKMALEEFEVLAEDFTELYQNNRRYYNPDREETLSL